MFGNDTETHWYLVIVDNRDGRKGVIYLDSSFQHNTTILDRRCQYHVTFINWFRAYLRDSLGMAIPDIDFSRYTHPFRNGLSVQQRNGFDCGVFALINCKRYIFDQPYQALRQASIKLIRAKIISELLEYGVQSGLV